MSEDGEFDESETGHMYTQEGVGNDGVLDFVIEVWASRYVLKGLFKNTPNSISGFLSYSSNSTVLLNEKIAYDFDARAKAFRALFDSFGGASVLLLSFGLASDFGRSDGPASSSAFRLFP